jgi:hypothetical protein
MSFAVPPYGRLRPARLADVPRIGFVAAAGFFHSTFFPYARPFYHKYPTDTVASYRAEYRECILDPTKLVLVALDEFKETEIDFVYDALRRIYPEHWGSLDPDEDGKVIVGIISMSLELNPIRHGQFNLDGTPDTSSLFRRMLILQGLDAPKSWRDPEDRARDTCSDALKMVDEVLKRPEEQYGMYTEPEVTCSPTSRWLSGHMEVLSLGTHPAYWKNYCGHELANWCAELADMDGVPLCASVSPMGAKVCKSFGFVEKELVTIKGHKYHPDDITISFQQRAVQKRAIKANQYRRCRTTSLERERSRPSVAESLSLQGSKRRWDASNAAKKKERQLH